jgi:hypothetical protein
MMWSWGLGKTILTLFLVLGSLLFILILLFPVRVLVFFEKQDENEQIRLEVCLFGNLIKIRRHIPYVKISFADGQLQVQSKIHEETAVKGGMGNDSSESQLHQDAYPSWIHVSVETIQRWYQWYARWKEFLARIQPYIVRILKTVRVDELTWQTSVGSGEAPETGFLAGALWAFKGCVLGVLYHYLTVQTQPQIQVHPNFNRKTLHTQIHCIFHVWLGQAMVAGLKLGVLLVREGLPWQNIQSKG